MNFASAQIFGLVIAGICTAALLLYVGSFVFAKIRRKNFAHVRAIGLVAIVVIFGGLFTLCALVTAHTRYVTHSVYHELAAQFPRGIAVNTALGEVWINSSSGCAIQLDEKKIHSKHVVYLYGGPHAKIIPLNQEKVDAAGRYLC